MIEQIPCDSVLALLQSQLSLDAQQTDFAALRHHVQQCRDCQIRLREAFSARMAIPVDSFDATCADCQADLAAYIDTALANGDAAANSMFPHVFWHILTCDTCYTTYTYTLALVQAEHAGELAPLPIPVRKPSAVKGLFPRINVSRRIFQPICAFQITAGTARGAAEASEAIIGEAETEDHELAISVQRSKAEWTIIVRIDPPLVGSATITLGATVRHAAFDQAGEAVVRDILSPQLTEQSGPDLEISIESGD